MTDHYEPLLARFGNVKPIPNGRGWKVRCPAHDDRTPSLVLWIGEQGELRCKCYAGCKWDAIRQAVGSETKEWFPEQDRKRPMENPSKKIVAVYQYHNADGSVAYEKVRYEPKSFVIRRPDPNKPGAYIWGRQNTEPTLYRLPSILNAPNQPVIVCEGEKDADAVAKLGLVATTGPDGAMGWNPEYGKWFKGRRVAIVPDNNAPGYQYAVAVAGSCILHGAASLRIVTLAVPADGDVSDYLAAQKGDKKKALVELIRQVPEWKAA